MTLGDAALKHEVLSLFHAHVALLMEKTAAVPALAHTLKGSALGIGAREVARARMHLSMHSRTSRNAPARPSGRSARAEITAMLAHSGE